MHTLDVHYSIAPRIPPGLAIGNGSGKLEMGNRKGQSEKSKSRRKYINRLTTIRRIDQTIMEHPLEVH